MTYLEIESFLTIAKLGNLSSAAEILFVSQPALSRRIKSLEEELGFLLFHRHKGGRSVQLTKEGLEFLEIARKWKHLWNETTAISNKPKQPVLNLASVDSVSSYIFPNVFKAFLKKHLNYKLSFHQYHSLAAYTYMESGFIDLAFVSDQRFSNGLKTIPAFSEPFVVATGITFEKKSVLLPEDLSPAHEIRLPWNDEYDIWHAKHFDESIYPYVFLDQMILLSEFLGENTWAIVPISVAHHLKEEGLHIYPLENGPADRMIYYLISESGSSEIINHFLHELDTYLKTLENVHSHLSSTLPIE